MELLVCVINNEDHLDTILSGFVDLGVRGATVIKSEGMARRVKGEVPVLAGLRELLEQARPNNVTLFSVIEDPATLGAAIRLIEDTCGDFSDPGTGILFTVPVTRAVGLMGGGK